MKKTKIVAISSIAKALDLEHELMARFELDYFRNQSDPVLKHMLSSVKIDYAELGLKAIYSLFGIESNHSTRVIQVFPRSILNSHISFVKMYSALSVQAAQRSVDAVKDLTFWLESNYGGHFGIDIDTEIAVLSCAYFDNGQLASKQCLASLSKLYRLPDDSGLHAVYAHRTISK